MCAWCQGGKKPPNWPHILRPQGIGKKKIGQSTRFGALAVTPRGKTYILLITYRFSRRADKFAVTAAEFTAEGMTNILVNQYIPLWGSPRNILSDNGLQFCSKLSQLSTSFWECASLPQAPIIQMVTEALSW